MYRGRNKAGFTIVELLIVIVVIAILAVITVVTYNGVQQRTKAASIVSDLKKTKRALRLYAIDKGTSTWWIDNDVALTGSSNPKITSIISAQPGFKLYLPRLSVGSSPNDWIYDEDGDVYPGCSPTSTAGANIFIYNTDASVAKDVDSDIDDGNLSCGRVTFSGTTLRYNLGPTPGV